MTAQTRKPESDTAKPETFIQYTGTSHVRSISAKEWKAAGVDDQDATKWDRTNAHRVLKSKLNAEALNYLLNVDGEFKEVEGK